MVLSCKLVIKIKTASHNCFSIIKRAGKNIENLRDVDIILCQETIWLEEDCLILENYDKNFKVLSVLSTPASSYLGDGRSIGGKTVYCRRHTNIGNYLENQNFQVICPNLDTDDVHLLNIYVPCDNGNNESMTNSLLALGKLQSGLDTLPSDEVIMMGDFNADYIRCSRVC